MNNIYKLINIYTYIYIFFYLFIYKYISIYIYIYSVRHRISANYWLPILYRHAEVIKLGSPPRRPSANKRRSTVRSGVFESVDRPQITAVFRRLSADGGSLESDTKTLTVTLKNKKTIKQLNN